MQTLALVIVVAAGLWLVAVAILMALRPDYCLHLFKKMTFNLDASNWVLNLTEQGLRILAGVALIVRSSTSKLPLIFELAGWLLVVSSILILAVPIRWHAGYGFWWARRLSPLIVRILSPIPVVVGAGLVYAAF